MASRLENSLYNVLTGVFGQILSFVLSFAIRTVFIQKLGELYLGINGLFTNILSVLNLAELGLGTAIVIEMYRTVETGDKEKTKQYLAFYRKSYYVIGSVILAVGMLTMPFLDMLINDRELLDLINYKAIWLMYLANTAFSYFFMGYRQAILQANQQEYKSRLISYGFKLLEMILQIALLLLFSNIYLYLAIPIVLGCTNALVQGVLIGRWFPFIKEKPSAKLSLDELKKTGRNVASVALYKVSGTVINSTDSIILSSFVSIMLTGVYSNYLVITSAMSTILSKLFSAFTASLGSLNVAAADDSNRKYRVFNALSLLNFWAYGFCAVCMYTLFDPFIEIWIGDRYILNQATEAAIVLNFLVVGLQETIGTHRAAYGLFYQGRYRPIFSIATNIVFSVLLVTSLPQDYGVVAVLLGTILSNLTTILWYDAWIVHKYAFNMKPFKFYLHFFCALLSALRSASA
ncbi:MAG: hypothetical protein Q4B51_07455 [Coriobacteriaceae bacterium]|nr:hypothetical protein [Coriobacteriaceae bacterium]